MAWFLARFKKRPWSVGIRLTGLLLVAWLSISLAFAYSLTRRRHVPFEERAPTVAWGRFEDHRIATRDGESLGAWLLPGEAEAPSVLLLHGNGGSRRQCLNIAEILSSEGCAVLLISFRAHGDSTGTFNDIGYGARHDVLAAIDFLERRRPGKPILIHGTSLGAAAAVFASGELAGRVHGYILECPYRDLRTAVRNRTRLYLPPVLDWVAFQGLMIASPLVLPHLKKIAPVEAVTGIPRSIPILILAGGEDRKATADESRSIYERVRSHARLSVYKTADHLRLQSSEPERYRKELLDFLHEATASSVLR